MRGINMNPGAVPDDMVAVRMFIDQDRIISSRRRAVLSIVDVRDSLLAGKGPKMVGDFLITLTGCLAGRIEREEGDHLTRHIEDLDLARENALVTQEELMNRVAQEQNSRMYLLSVVAAIFLPLTFVTGLLGMNVAGLPGTESPCGFVFSAAIMILTGIALAGYFRWRKWI
jgi:hypothetical protein